MHCWSQCCRCNLTLMQVTLRCSSWSTLISLEMTTVLLTRREPVRATAGIGSFPVEHRWCRCDTNPQSPSLLASVAAFYISTQLSGFVWLISNTFLFFFYSDFLVGLCRVDLWQHVQTVNWTFFKLTSDVPALICKQATLMYLKPQSGIFYKRLFFDLL